jgi:signal transduction histidine kinase
MVRTDQSEGDQYGASEAMFMLDQRGIVVSWNRAAVALTGISEQDILGKPFATQLLFPEDIAQWTLQFEEIAAGMSGVRKESRWRIPGDLPRECFSRQAFPQQAFSQQALDSHSLFRNGEGDLVGFISPVEACPTRELLDTSRYLHDTVSQTLVEISFRVSRLQAATRELPCAGEVGEVLNAIHRCCRQIRLIGCVMAPSPPAAGDLRGAIERYAGDVQREADAAIVVQCDGAVEGVPAEVEYLMLAAVREWIRRAVFNEGKTCLFINLEGGDFGVRLELKSIPGQAGAKSNALKVMTEGWEGIRERARALGGHLDITNGMGVACARMSLPRVVSA